VTEENSTGALGVEHGESEKLED